MRTITEKTATEAASRLIDRFRGTARVTNPTDEFAEVLYHPGLECTYNDIIEAAMLYVDDEMVRINSVYLAGIVLIQFFLK